MTGFGSGGLATASRLTKEQIDHILSIAARGRNLDGDLRPILVGGTPKCHSCGKLYPAGRLKADVPMPHLCCGCKTVVEHHQPRNGHARGYHGHMARVPSGRDDCRGI